MSSNLQRMQGVLSPNAEAENKVPEWYASLDTNQLPRAEINPTPEEVANAPYSGLINEEGTGFLQDPWTYAGLLPVARGAQVASKGLQGARQVASLKGRGNAAGNLGGGGRLPPGGGQGLPPPGGNLPAQSPGTQVGFPRPHSPGTQVGRPAGPKDMGWAQRVKDGHPAFEALPGGSQTLSRMLTSESLPLRLVAGASALGALLSWQGGLLGESPEASEVLQEVDDGLVAVESLPEAKEEVFQILDTIEEVPEEVLETLPPIPAEALEGRAHRLEKIIQEWEAGKEEALTKKNQGWGVRALRMLVPAIAGAVAGPLGVLAGGAFGYLQGEVDAHNIDNRHAARVDDWYTQRLDMEKALIGQQEKDFSAQYLLPRQTKMEDWSFLEGQRKAGREAAKEGRDIEKHGATMRQLDKQDAFANMYLDALGGEGSSLSSSPLAGQVADPRLNAKVIRENAQNIIARYPSEIGPDLFTVFNEMIEKMPLAEGANKTAAEAGILVQLILKAADDEKKAGIKGQYTQMAEEMFQAEIASQQASNLKTLKSLSGI